VDTPYAALDSLFLGPEPLGGEADSLGFEAGSLDFTAGSPVFALSEDFEAPSPDPAAFRESVM
jgi:hypothetical protein